MVLALPTLEFSTLPISPVRVWPFYEPFYVLMLP